MKIYTLISEFYYITFYILYIHIYIYSLRFYLFIHERHRQREKQAPCREPDVGLDPEIPDHTLGAT